MKNEHRIGKKERESWKTLAEISAAVLGTTALLVAAAIAPIPGNAASASTANAGTAAAASPASTIDAFEAHPHLRVYSSGAAKPGGLAPAQLKEAYHLPLSGGSGTIAIISAYASPTLEQDLLAFSGQFGLPFCPGGKNGCLEIHPMAKGTPSNKSWALETALDTQWAHAMAPQAKILVVQAVSPKGPDLLKAIDYARKRKDVVAVSMSWGGPEFIAETKLDTHFQGANASSTSPVFFASSGDSGTGASWPAASSKVIAVGGTSLSFDATGAFKKETAWTGSGGGISQYESASTAQAGYGIPSAKGKRAIPDVAYDADPHSGFPVYLSAGTAGAGTGTDAMPVTKSKAGNWYVIGGTSAGAPQWAAIHSLAVGLNHSADAGRLYADKASIGHAVFFRDIVSGSNGTCGKVCEAGKHYDFVTGLGTPQTAEF